MDYLDQHNQPVVHSALTAVLFLSQPNKASGQELKPSRGFKLRAFFLFLVPF